MTDSMRIRVMNYRRLADFELSVDRLACIFGPNGAGKSTLFDALAFMRDLIDVGSGTAFTRHGGVTNLTSIDAHPGQPIWLEIERKKYVYSLGVHGTAHEDMPINVQERLVWQDSTSAQQIILFNRNGNNLKISDNSNNGDRLVRIADLERSAWFPFLEQSSIPSAEFDALKSFLADVQKLRHFSMRRILMAELGRRGSRSQPGFMLGLNGLGLWNCLRNLRNQSRTSSRYAVIIKYIRDAFPQFVDFDFVQTSSDIVGCRIQESGLSESYPSSNAPDGLVQFTFNLAAIFGESETRQIVLLDEPDLSLHPWALFVLAKAIEEATIKWNRQVLLATHSPVLLSQFSEESLFLMMPNDGATTIQRVSEMTENRDLLNQYAVGSLYMSQLIGEQSSEPMVHVVETEK